MNKNIKWGFISTGIYWLLISPVFKIGEGCRYTLYKLLGEDTTRCDIYGALHNFLRPFMNFLQPKLLAEKVPLDLALFLLGVLPTLIFFIFGFVLSYILRKLLKKHA